MTADDSMKSLRHERPSGRFPKSRGLTASVSLLHLPLPLPPPPLPLFSCDNSLLQNFTETLATQAINMMIQTLYFLPICLQFLWIQLPQSFTTRFIDESVVSYYLTWHMPLSKTHRVPSFILECSNSRPPLAKCIKQQRQKTTKASSSIAMALRCPDFFLSKFPDFGLF